MKKLETIGVAPKTLAAAAIPLIAGVVLLLADKLADAGIDDTLWLTLILSAVPIGGGAWVAPAAPTKVVPARKRNGEAGYGLVELLIAAILLLVFIWVLFAVVR